jgi:hypothetical protein
MRSSRNGLDESVASCIDEEHDFRLMMRLSARIALQEATILGFVVVVFIPVLTRVHWIWVVQAVDAQNATAEQTACAAAIR